MPGNQCYRNSYQNHSFYRNQYCLYFPGLIAGFVIFCFSGFGGTQALGWLTSLTLVMATLTNLIFYQLLIAISRKKNNVVNVEL